MEKRGSLIALENWVMGVIKNRGGPYLRGVDIFRKGSFFQEKMMVPPAREGGPDASGSTEEGPSKA